MTRAATEVKPGARASVPWELGGGYPGLVGVAGHIPFRDSDIVCHGGDRVAF